MIQGSEEWFAARCGKVTASRINDVMAKIKKGEAAGRRNYKAQLVVERLTGLKQDTYQNAAMQWGIEHEDEAKAAFEFMFDIEVKPVAFVVHPEIPDSGASPDGLVGDDGLIEIKCPNTATHIDYLLGGVAPADYLSQMQWQLACTGRKYCHFVSYDPRMPVELQLFHVKVHRDDERIKETTDEVLRFLGEVEEIVNKLNKMAA